MPSTLEATAAFQKAGICYGPAKCAQCRRGGNQSVEMEQTPCMTSWTFDEVDGKLKGIMAGLVQAAHDTARRKLSAR
jgi:glutamate dehydrogenase (NADP+)